jgi:hypothetical protein
MDIGGLMRVMGGGGGGDEPEVLTVRPSAIRDRIEWYIGHCAERALAYRAASARGEAPKISWLRHAERIERELAPLHVMRESVVEAPIAMSISAFKAFWDHFAPYKTVDEMIKSKPEEETPS